MLNNLFGLLKKKSKKKRTLKVGDIVGERLSNQVFYYIILVIEGDIYRIRLLGSNPHCWRGLYWETLYNIENDFIKIDELDDE